MLPTLIGILIAVVGLLMMFVGSKPSMLSLVMICGLMSGSAALVVPALGNSSVPPLQLASIFLIIRIILPSDRMMTDISLAVRANIYFVAYVFYSVIAAYVLPRVFQGAMQVPPLRFTGLTYLYATVPLAPSSQNITTAIYLIGTLLIAISVHVAIKSQRGPEVFVKTSVFIGIGHSLIGIFGVIVKGTALDGLLRFFRNGSYAQLDQSYGSFIRITGISPEPSVYASYAFSWFVLLFECWLRKISSRWTGAASFSLLIVLLSSTSGIAYVGLSLYAIILLLRLVVPGSVVTRNAIPLIGGGIAAAVLTSVVLITLPSLATNFADMFYHMTVDKGGSSSGLQRAFWAKKGLEAFWVSYGFGIGPGSFRSSSLGTAILGSTGVIGATTFFLYLIKILKPSRASTYIEIESYGVALGAAASWAAFACLIPSMIGAPSADPGPNFAIFAAVALAMRANRVDVGPRRSTGRVFS